jgi:endonuclease YncB( thermonuclease family)
MRWTGIGLAAFALSGPAFAGPLPSCANSVEIADVRVAAVTDDGTLALAGGRKLKLEGILLPEGRFDRAPGAYRERAIAALASLAEGRSIVAAAQSPLQDRYGRIEAQIVLSQNPDNGWLQVAMLERGLARVFITPERPECADELFAAERKARGEGNGIWSSSAYAVRTPETLSKRDTGTFQIVQGKVVSAAVKGGRAYLDFGADWRSDFTATVAPGGMKLFRKSGIDPRTYAGQTVRVRGWIDEYHGPEIEIAAPQDIEMVE